MPSATDLITSALRLLGVVDATETPSAEDLAAGKTVLDEFIDALGLQRASIFQVTRSVYPLSASVASYTIGTGGTFNQVRPIWIDSASVRPDRTASPVLEIPVGRPLTIAEYQTITDKSLTSEYPTALYYDHAWAAGLGTITVYPTPTTSLCDLVLYVPQAVTGFADLTTVYTFPPGYGRMLRYNLANDLSNEFPGTGSPRIDQVARESLAQVKRANHRATDVGLDPGLPGMSAGRYNLYTGDYSGGG